MLRAALTLFLVGQYLRLTEDGDIYVGPQGSTVNGAMLVSTIPHGGHHLFDLIIGGVIAVCAIAFVRVPLGVRRHAISGGAGLVNA